jgi:hypothetical protein
LRQRLLEQGFLFLREVIAVEVVTAARAALSAFSSSLHTAAVAFDAQTGHTSTIAAQNLSASAQRAGNSEEMTNLYENCVKELCQKLCTVEPDAAAAGTSAGAAAAMRAPSFTPMPQCTWMRVVSKRGQTPEHSDLMFFLRQTDYLLDVYRDHPHVQRAVAAAAQAAAATAAQRSKCCADKCKASIRAKLLVCAACRLQFHSSCQRSSKHFGDEDQKRRWHCDQCVNAPSPFYTCWMPLTDLGDKVSRLQVLPRSHLLAGYERMQKRNHDADLLPGDYTSAKLDEFGLEWATAPHNMKAGDVILFNWKLIHAATSHEDTEYPRLSVDSRLALHALDC